MKILIVIPALGPVYGGTTKSVLELAQALGQRGINVDIIATTANGSNRLDVPTQVWITEKYYRVQYFPYWNCFDYKISLSLSSWLFRHINGYDLVHTNAIFSYPVLPAHWACQIYGVPYIMTPHGMLEPWALAYKAGKKSFYFSLLEKPCLQRASAIQMLASTEAQQVASLGLKAPLIIVPNAIHQEDFIKLPSPDVFYQEFPVTRNKKLILFLGRIDPKKGLDLLATAFAKVRTQFPESHLVIAGPDNIGFTSTVQNYFTNLRCLDAVTFTGMLSGSLKYAALAAADLYVAPSYSEGFSVSVLEGMAAKLPCIITTGCNFPEAAIAKAAMVVDIDADQIANGLIECLKNHQQAQAMGERARQLILANYTWDKIAEQMQQVYTNIIKQKSKLELS